MKEGQKFKLIKWNKQLISVATGILLVSQLAVGPIQVLAETTDSTSTNSSENIDSENQLDVGMSSDLFTAENQNSDGNTGEENQRPVSRGTTSESPSPQLEGVKSQEELQNAITAVTLGASETITIDASFTINTSALVIENRDITLTSTNDATLTRLAGYTGSVFTVQNAGSLTLNGVSIDGNEDNKGTVGSSLVTLNSATFTLEDGTINNGNAQYGGAINAPIGSDNNTININGGTLSNNKATYGGAIYSVESTNKINLNGGTISDNEGDYGGGINSGNAELIIDGGTIIDNTASRFGGGIRGTRITMNSGAINDNKQVGDNFGIGGGIYVIGSDQVVAEVNINGGEMIRNQSAGGGGAIFADSNERDMNVNITGGIISRNTAPAGGAIAVADLNLNISGGTISDNTATNGTGNAIVNSGGTVTMTGGLIYGVANATTDLVSNSEGTWNGPTENGVIIGKSTTNNSPYEWESDTDLIKEFGENILSQTPYWTIKGEAVGIGYLKSDGSESFIPVPDAKIKLIEDLLDTSSKTYTGSAQKISTSVEHADFVTAFGKEVTLQYQAIGSDQKTDIMTNAGTYDVFAEVTAVNSKLFGVGSIEPQVIINPARRTQADFNYDKEINLTYAGTGLKAAITAKYPTAITDFSVKYIKDGDSTNKELTEITEAGTYSIRIKINTDTNANYNTPAAFTLSDAKVIVKEQKPEKEQPDATMYQATIPSTVVYNGKIPEIAISSKGEDLGTISTILKQDDVEVSSPNVGTYQVYARNTGSEKYNATDTLLGEFTITAKPLTISAADVEVQQGATLPTTMINYTGFAEGEDADTIFSELPTGEYAGDSSISGTSDIEINEGTTTDAANNYKISYVAGTLIVTENSLDEEEQDRLPLYRVYNKNNGEHLYTLSQSEAQGLIDKGWQDEGVGWYGGEKTGKAVYRLYNPNSGEHFYTLDQDEYDSVGQAGWNKERIAFYAAEDTEIPIYRVFNPNSQDAGSHHYTLSMTENTWLVRQGWRSENVGFYGK